jgi:hypothetical protein
MKHKFELVAVAMFSIAAWGTANSQSDSADLAQELTNPIADLVTVPIQMNFDNDIGPLDEGNKIQREPPREVRRLRWLSQAAIA